MYNFQFVKDNKYKDKLEVDGDFNALKRIKQALM